MKKIIFRLVIRLSNICTKVFWVTVFSIIVPVIQIYFEIRASAVGVTISLCIPQNWILEILKTKLDLSECLYCAKKILQTSFRIWWMILKSERVQLICTLHELYVKGVRKIWDPFQTLITSHKINIFKKNNASSDSWETGVFLITFRKRFTSCGLRQTG